MSDFILSVIEDGERKQIRSSLEEWEFFSVRVSGKLIRVVGGKLELEGPIKIQPATAADEALTLAQHQVLVGSVNEIAAELDAANDQLVAMRLLAAANAGEAARVNDQLLYLKANTPKEARLVSGAGGQTVFSVASSGMNFDPSNAVVDIKVWVYNQRQRQDLDGLLVEAYRKISPTQIEFSETIPEGVPVDVEQPGYNFYNEKPAEPFFRNYADGETTLEVGTGDVFDVGTQRLSVYRGGLALVPDAFKGDVDARYAEKSLSSVELGLVPTAEEVFAFYHLPVAPSYKTIITGAAGTALTVPAYLTGTKRLRVWRNGILMVPQAIGPTENRYSESSGTTVTLEVAAAEDDVFLVEYAGTAPQWRDDLTGITGVDIDFTLGNTYTLGDKKLQVYRNGLLMLQSASLGDPFDRYSENGTGAILLTQAATADEVFTAIYL